MNKGKEQESEEILGKIEPSKAIIKLAIPATLALLAKAVYNILIQHILVCFTLMWR